MTEESRATCVYFAIGSMCNDTSIRLRGIIPYNSVPAFIRGQKLDFVGALGMATIEESENPDDKVHGVIHYLTPEHMEKLDQLEGLYDRLPMEAHIYKPHDDTATSITTVTAGAYRVNKDRSTPGNTAKPPTERYVDIITRACRQFGVAQSYIDWLLSLEVQPRVKPENYKKFNHLPRVFGPCRVFSLPDIKQWDGEEGRMLCISVNGKVVRYNGDPSSSDVRMTKARVGGRDGTFMVIQMFYEPIYPVVKSVEEMSKDHKAFAEDMICGLARAGSTEDKWVVIGWLKEYGEPPVELQCIPYSPENKAATEAEALREA